MLALGHARVREYQDDAYATLYVERACSVCCEAERAADPAAAGGFAIDARGGALPGAVDGLRRHRARGRRSSDAPSRCARVRREVAAGDDDVVRRSTTTSSPACPKFAGLLPPRLARALVRWDRRAPRARRRPWAVPMQAGHPHRVRHRSRCALLAALTRLRRRGHRYADEQALIERWLDAVGARHAHGLAAGPRDRAVRPSDQGLRRHQRARQREPAAHRRSIGRARAVCVARAARAGDRAGARAALADEAGSALDATLLRHGGAPRPPREVPIRFVRRVPAAAARSPRCEARRRVERQPRRTIQRPGRRSWSAGGSDGFGSTRITLSLPSLSRQADFDVGERFNAGLPQVAPQLGDGDELGAQVLADDAAAPDQLQRRRLDEAFDRTHVENEPVEQVVPADQRRDQDQSLARASCSRRSSRSATHRRSARPAARRRRPCCRRRAAAGSGTRGTGTSTSPTRG